MQGQSGAPRVVASGGVDQQHLGHNRERPHRGLEDGAFAQREQTRDVRARGLASHGRLSYYVASEQRRRSAPDEISARATSGQATLEGNRARADGELAGGPAPRLGSGGGKRPLRLD